MINLQNNPTETYPLMHKFSTIICLGSTRKSGNLEITDDKLSEQVSNFLILNNINSTKIVVMEQTHGDIITEINHDKKAYIEGVDGIYTKLSNIFLTVRTADCVPIFFYDKQKKIIGIVHAGWKGTLKEIAKKMINTFQKNGSKITDIHIFIGPHIGNCCYKVFDSRAELFQNKFKYPHIIVEKNKQKYLDLGLLNYLQLIDSGLLGKNIDMNKECTGCNSTKYFSYRKDGINDCGRMLGVIAMIN